MGLPRLEPYEATATPVTDPPGAPIPQQAPLAPAERAPAADRQRALDGMRFLAALAVVFFHLIAVAGMGSGTARPADIWGAPAREVFGWLYVPAAYGWLGVHLFFMISGFVICMSSWGRTGSQFALSRIVRLFPAYWAAIAVTTAFVLLYPAIFEAQKLGDVLTNLTMLQEQFGVPHVDPVYWSLVAELKFYLLFLIVAAFGVTYRRAVIFCVVWSIGAAFAVQLDVKALKLFLMPNFAHYFVAGVALYLMYRFGPNIVLWGIIGYSWVIAMHYRTDSSFPADVGLPYWPAAVLITACFAILILLALRRLQWMRWRFLTTLGVTTYPLYLLHYVIGTSVVYLIAKHWAVNAFVLFCIVVAGLIVLSWLVHRLIERPLAPRLKRVLAGGMDNIRKNSPG